MQLLGSNQFVLNVYLTSSRPLNAVFLSNMQCFCRESSVILKSQVTVVLQIKIKSNQLQKMNFAGRCYTTLNIALCKGQFILFVCLPKVRKTLGMIEKSNICC